MGQILVSGLSGARIVAASLAISISGFSLVGCGYAEPKTQPVSTLQRTPTADFKVAPKEMVKLIEQAVSTPPLSLAIESNQGGIVQTGWKEYRGELHIVRYWFERTKFQIVVTPDFDEPTAKCRVQVFDLTEERATESQPWYPTNKTERPERSAEILAAIKSKVGA